MSHGADPGSSTAPGPADEPAADCLFCRIVAGEVPATVVRSTDTTVAFRDIAPSAPSHVLVVPRRHVPDIATLAADPPLLADLVHAAAEVAGAEGIVASGWRMVANTGRDAGQTIFHVHLHVLGGATLAPLG